MEPARKQLALTSEKRLSTSQRNKRLLLRLKQPDDQELKFPKKKVNEMHKAIMKKAAKALEKDAKHYSKEAKGAKGVKKKHELVEKKEASKGAKVMKKMAKKAHEY